ncbi:M-phase phosphoprotein 6 [Halotydeus destructor]|nr:M-phase phosphoprotein 6 [Halotydeus destructor]
MSASKVLSKNLLQMKFMQRTKEKHDLKEEEDKSAHLLDKDVQIESSNRFRVRVEPSYEVCEQLVFGRMSFKGCNVEIERLMQEKNQIKEAQAPANVVDVSNKEMVNRYRKINMNSANGDQYRMRDNKRKRKTKYVRPVD